MNIFTETQWHYIKFWLIVVIIVEGVMLVLNRYLPVIYLIIAAIFLGRVILRLTSLYPEKKEPLILDATAVLISLIMAYIAELTGISGWRFLLILTSSIIVMPRLAYIVKNL